MEQQKYDNLKRGEHGAMISIAAYILLSSLKLIIGYTADSAALRADGLNNATDIIASIAVLIGLRISQRPADDDHKYGHWKSETIASLVASFIMMAVGLQVLIDTISTLFEGKQESPDFLAAYVGIGSALVMYFVYRYNKKLSEEIESKAVMAAAKDNLSDAWVSVGTTIGIVGSQFGMPWLDVVTAIIVGFLICKTAWDIFTEASHELTDGFDEKKLKMYEDVIFDLEGVKGIKSIKGRNYGNNEVVDVVILVNSTLNIHQAHDIATRVEDTLTEEYGVYDIHVHVEPE